MTCEELSQEYTAFALGIAGPAERDAITEHLTRKCPVCTPGVVSALATVSAMSGAVKEVEPPRRLRARVISMVQPEPGAQAAPKPALVPQARPRSNRWLAIAPPWGLAAALAVALFTVAVPRRLDNTTRLAEALSILNDPAAKDVTFGLQPGPSRGRVIVSPSRGVVFIGANLPRIDSGRTFELWVIPAGGNPIPAGTFHAADDLSAVYVHSGPLEANAGAVAVTVEPAGGSPQPTTKPFIIAPLS